MNLGPTELIIILAIVLLLFGSRKLPDLARSLGKSSREFKKGLSEADKEDDQDDATPAPPAAEAPATDPANPPPPQGAATDGQPTRPEDRTGS